MSETVVEAERSVDAPIVRVTLLEDRAQVRREGRLALPAGSHRLRVSGVSPAVVDRSVRARAGAGLRVDEVKVERRWRIGEAELPDDVAARTAEVRRLEAELHLVEARLAIGEQLVEALAQSCELAMSAIDRELPFAEAFPAERAQAVEALFAELRTAQAGQERLSREVRGVRDRLSAARLRKQTRHRSDHALATTLLLSVSVTEGGEHELSIDYQVPCALWRPSHRATLRDGTLRFECEGAVWQATGEDWIEVELAFSTARSSQRAEPPLLHDDVLHAQRRADRKVQVELREAVIATTGEGRAVASEEPPGVDDGGETRLLPGRARATIRSDGRLHRVPIFAFEAPAEVDRLARPERAATVFLRSRQDNAGAFPILAGPVELLRDSGVVGRTELGFVAPGERFALSFGADDALRVRRDVEEVREPPGLLGKLVIDRKVTLSLSNLDAAEATFRIEERIPVSELAQVQVEVDAKRSERGARADEHGIVGLAAKVPARGTARLTLAYRITASSDVQGRF